MAIALTTTPKRTIEAVESNVTAGLSQIPYGLQRQDYTLTGSADAAGQTVLNVDPVHGNITGAVAIGDQLYAKGADYTIGLCNVVSVLWADPITEILVDAPWVIGIGVGFFNFKNKRTDYKMLINIAVPATNEQILPQAMSYTPNSFGYIFINIANLLVELSQGGGAVNFKMVYSEFYDGDIKNTTYDDPVFAIVSKRQLLDKGGANMWRYLPNVAGVGLGVGKQLNEFINPFVYVGWRSWLSTIYDENINVRLGSIPIGFRLRSTDRNGVVLDEQTFLQLPQNLPNIHIQDIPEELKTVANAYFLSCYVNSSNAGAVSQNIVMPIKKPCKNPVMIEWIGRNGGSEQYMFSHNQEIITDAQEGVTFETPITDTLDNVFSTVQRLTEGSIQYMTLTAENIPKQHIQVLKYLKESPRILLWLDNQGSEFVQVVVAETFSTPIATKQVFGTFTVQLRLPKNFDFLKPRE